VLSFGAIDCRSIQPLSFFTITNLMVGKNIFIIGISGTGKSTISRKLAALTGLSLYHMDSIIWSENWVESDDQKIQLLLDKISDTDGWIVEGWIDKYSNTLLECADLILYLDYPGWLAMWGGLQRWWFYRGTKRPEMPYGCDETLDLEYLRTMLYRRERPHIERILAELKPRNVLRVMSRHEVERYLSQLVKELELLQLSEG
jgi:adenylate kinase family enzyme